MKLTPKQYLTPQEKKKDFWRGFWLWWGLNILMSLILGVLFGVGLNQLSTLNETSPWVSPLVTAAAGWLPFLINIGVVIYLALTRSQMALGMLVGFASALALVMILGVALTVACFVALGSGSGL